MSTETFLNSGETDGRGWTPLLYAVLAGDVAVVDALIRSGADVNAAAPDGATPLIKAALWGHTEMVGALLDAGADPDRRDHSGWSALDLAETGRYIEMTDLLRAAHEARMERQSRSAIAEKEAQS